MTDTHRRPQHSSYRKHRSQVVWQIILPTVLAGLLLIGAAYLVGVSTFRGGGDVARWAAISTMWLTIPVMIGALVLLVIVIALAYLIGRLVGFIPPYTYQAQAFAYKVEAGARRVSEVGHRPAQILPELGKLLKLAFRRIRGR